MENLPLFISLLFFFSFIIYSFLGIYILNLNPKANTNKAFFAICVTLSIWTFAFSIANSAPNLEIALIWRRIAVLGWGLLYSVLLHFILILTEKDSILKQAWIYPLLYLPAAVIIFVFAISYDMVIVQYNLIT